MMTKATKLNIEDMLKCPICDFPLVLSDDNFFCKNHGNKNNILKICFDIIQKADRVEDIKKEVIEFMQMMFADRLTYVGNKVVEKIGNGIKMLQNFADRLKNIDSKKRDDSISFQEPRFDRNGGWFRSFFYF